MEIRKKEKRNLTVTLIVLIAIVDQILIVIVCRTVIRLLRVLEIVPCHRMKSRSLTIKGYTLPLCARCTGILAGYLFFPVLLVIGWNFPLWLGILLNFPMVIDGWTQKRKYRMSNNPLRFTTGIISGFGQSIIIVSISDFIISIV